MLRTILIAALGALLITGQARGDPSCPSPDRIMSYVKDSLHISSSPVAYTGAEAEGISSGLMRASADAEPARSFISFDMPLYNSVLLVSFVNNCAVAMMEVPSGLFRQWVNGQRAGR